MLAGNMLTYVSIEIWHHASLAGQQGNSGVLLNHTTFLAFSFSHSYFTVQFFHQPISQEREKKALYPIFKIIPSSINNTSIFTDCLLPSTNASNVL